MVGDHPAAKMNGSPASREMASCKKRKHSVDSRIGERWETQDKFMKLFIKRNRRKYASFQRVQAEAGKYWRDVLLRGEKQVDLEAYLKPLNTDEAEVSKKQKSLLSFFGKKKTDSPVTTQRASTTQSGCANNEEKNSTHVLPPLMTPSGDSVPKMTPQLAVVCAFADTIGGNGTSLSVHRMVCNSTLLVARLHNTITSYATTASRATTYADLLQRRGRAGLGDLLSKHKELSTVFMDALLQLCVKCARETALIDRRVSMDDVVLQVWESSNAYNTFQRKHELKLKQRKRITEMSPKSTTSTGSSSQPTVCIDSFNSTELSWEDAEDVLTEDMVNGVCGGGRNSLKYNDLLDIAAMIQVYGAVPVSEILPSYVGGTEAAVINLLKSFPVASLKSKDGPTVLLHLHNSYMTGCMFSTYNVDDEGRYCGTVETVIAAAVHAASEDHTNATLFVEEDGQVQLVPVIDVDAIDGENISVATPAEVTPLDAEGEEAAEADMDVVEEVTPAVAPLDTEGKEEAAEADI